MSNEPSRQPRRWKLATRLGVLFLLFYVGSYLCLSRMGFQEADERRFQGFYFMDQGEPYGDMFPFYLAKVYHPLILVDVAIGPGRPGGDGMYRSRNALHISPAMNDETYTSSYSSCMDG